MSESLSDLLTQLEPDDDDGYTHLPRDMARLRAHLATKFGDPIPRIPSAPIPITTTTPESSDEDSFSFPDPPILASSSLPSPISPFLDATTTNTPPSPTPSRKRNSSLLTPTPPVSPVRHSSSSSSSSSSSIWSPEELKFMEFENGFIEEWIGRWENRDPFEGRYQEREAWVFSNPLLKNTLFHPPRIQQSLNEISKDENYKVWEREMQVVRLINDAGFSQVLQHQGGSGYMQLVFDPEAEEMCMKPINTAALCTLLSNLFYRPLGPKKQPELEDIDGVPDGLKKGMSKNHLYVSNIYPRSVFKKQYTGLVFWPWCPPGDITVNTDIVPNKVAKFEGIQYAFLRDQEIVKSKKTALENATYPPCFFFNQWRGFRFYTHPIHKAPRFNLEWSRLVLGRMQSYLFEIVCNGNKIHYEYFSKWMAWIRQHPEVRTNVVPIMIGYEGAGKSIWHTEVLVKCFGPHGITLANWTDLLHKFGGPLVEKAIIVAAEEVDFTDEKMVNIYKSMVTGEFARVEHKGHSIYQARNYKNFILSTNKAKFGNLGLTGGRRWFVLYVSDKYANKSPESIAFFENFMRLLEENDSFALRVFDFWLREMDLTGFKTSLVPTSEALNNNIQAFMDPIDNWWLDKIRDQQHVPVDPDDALSASTTSQAIIQEVHPKAARSGTASYWGWLQWPVNFNRLHRDFLESKHGKYSKTPETEFLFKLRSLLPIGTVLNMAQKTFHMPSFVECQERAFKLFGIHEPLFNPDAAVDWKKNPAPDPTRLRQTTITQFATNTSSSSSSSSSSALLRGFIS